MAETTKHVRVGLLPYPLWVEKVEAPHSNFRGVTPSDIGVRGPIRVAGLQVLVMVRDPDEEGSTNWGAFPLTYTRAEQYARVWERLKKTIEAMLSSEFQAQFNNPTKAARLASIVSLREHLVTIEGQPDFIRAMRDYGARLWFIENAEWLGSGD